MRPGTAPSHSTSIPSAAASVSTSLSVSVLTAVAAALTAVAVLARAGAGAPSVAWSVSLSATKLSMHSDSVAIIRLSMPRLLSAFLPAMTSILSMNSTDGRVFLDAVLLVSAGGALRLGFKGIGAGSSFC